MKKRTDTNAGATTKQETHKQEGEYIIYNKETKIHQPPKQY
jgi:hypothetical protein